MKTEDAASEVNRTILVVDDEKDLLELALGHLEECGYKVIGAASGQEALQRLEENRCGSAVYRYCHAGQSGRLRTGGSGRAQNPQLKVLFTSGFGKQPNRHNQKFQGPCC